jgi:hypothetical protein
MLGIEPVLAVSYYEFATSLIDENVENALFYYKYSDFLTGVLTVSSACSVEQGSRYVGIPEQSNNLWSFTLSRYQDYFIIYSFVGFFGGLAIGILLAYNAILKIKEKKKEKQVVPWSPHSVTHYQQPIIHESEKKSFDSFPKNINDYFNESKKD